MSQLDHVYEAYIKRGGKLSKAQFRRDYWKRKIKDIVSNNVGKLTFLFAIMLFLAVAVTFMGTAWTFFDVLINFAQGINIPLFSISWLQLLTFIVAIVCFCAWVVWIWAFQPVSAYGLIRAKMKPGYNAVMLNQQPSMRGYFHPATEEINGAVKSQGIDRMGTPRSAIVVGGVPIFLTFGESEFTISPEYGEAATDLAEEGIPRELALNGGTLEKPVTLPDGKSIYVPGIPIPVAQRTIRLSDFSAFFRQMDSGVATERIAQERERKLTMKLLNPLMSAWPYIVMIAALAMIPTAIYISYTLFGPSQAASAPSNIGAEVATRL